MKLVMLAAVWYLAVAIAGVATWGSLRRMGIGAGASWAVARLAGWVGAGFAAWMAGVAGVSQWWWVALAVLLLLALVGWRSWRGVAPASLVDVELVGVAAFVLLAWLRVPVMAISGTEKPMDLAILATLMRPGGFPPADPWLAGEALPYYYWGFVPWVAPAKLLGLAPDVLYNLLVPTLAAVTAQVAWALARSLGGSRRSAGLASFLVVFAGTPDGWRQWLGGTNLGDLDLWASSRQIPGTITEFPLFTFHLGDLHPHLLATPLVLLALFLARSWACTGVRAGLAVPVVAVAYGAAAAANPWCALPTGVAVLLLVVAREEGFLDPRRPRDGLAVWLQVAAAGALGWVLFAPFWLHFSPPATGFAVVPRGTRWDHLLLFLGAVLLPALLVSWEVVRRWGSFAAPRRQLAVATWVAAMTVIAALSGKPGLALGLGIGVVLLATSMRGRRRRGRPVWVLTAVAAFLLVTMELIYFKDPYGAEFFRMNTVFKASHQAFTLLAVAVPVLLGWLRRRREARAVAAAALVVAAGLPHLAVLAWRSGPSVPQEWSGLTWMVAGERDAARWLHRREGGAVLVEAVGDAYSDAARMSSASGVPAALGWENHQLVWRGDGVRPEIERRKRLIESVYTSADGAAIAAAARELGARYIVVGSKERQAFAPEGLEVVRRAGRAAFVGGEIEIIDLHD